MVLLTEVRSEAMFGTFDHGATVFTPILVFSTSGATKESEMPSTAFFADLLIKLEGFFV